ncbi:hypothetical protein [Spiroplasma cantharicola]|uniref:Uncharacterized protein n=1 Tax=Spiroplasma cantharicola TaxID=362837 RepID=A0A0M4JIF2_9MOLU|nr:hypothetical protein [Spiroplasma cantharicola]ALD66379.1 hypothetical protein SCANT_v1c04730 [Spiroplasma cantharicola]
MGEKIIKNELLKNLVNKQDLYKAAKNIKLSNEDTQRFIESIFSNYFLDNDNINFLVKNGYNFFAFEDQELCFCLSGEEFLACCKKHLAKTKNPSYTPFIKAIIATEKYEDYLKFSSQLFESNYSKLAKTEKCNFVNCEQKAVENSLYDFELDNEKYLTSNKRNIFDNNYKMGESFFNEVQSNQFKYFGFCQNHMNQISEIKMNKNSNDAEILLFNFPTIVNKLFISRVQLEALKEEFRNYFNSIEEEAVKPMFIYNLKKVSNHVSSLLETYTFFVESLSGKTNNFAIAKFSLPKTNNFRIKDVFQPQITPDDFKVVNSINNFFISENFASLVMFSDKTNSFITMVYDKSKENLNAFFDQYLKIIHLKSKSEAAFISNCSLILADNILFRKQWFDKLDEQEKLLYSALNKFRFQHPNMGQEYLKMKFFAGFNKGNNFF